VVGITKRKRINGGKQANKHKIQQQVYMSSGFPSDTVGSETDVFELETRRFVVPTNRSRILAGGAK